MRVVPDAVGIAIAVIGLVGSSATAQSDGPAQKGNEAYQYWCATCHGQGPGHPGTTALAAKYTGALPGLLEQRSDLTPTAVGIMNAP